MNNTTSKEFDIYQMKDRLIGYYGEIRMGTELLKKGWDVYQPVSDQYIDLIATKKIPIKNTKYKKKYRQIIRTFQVKTSRLEERGKKDTYGINPRPKDLLHDQNHNFIWILYDAIANENFVVIRPFEYVKWKSKDGAKTLQEHTWLNNAQREHFKFDSVKNFTGLNNLSNIKRNNFGQMIDTQERNSTWKIENKNNYMKKWEKAQKHIIKNIPKEIYEKIRGDDTKSSGVFDQLLKKYNIPPKKKIFPTNSLGKIHFPSHSKYSQAINRSIFNPLVASLKKSSISLTASYDRYLTFFSNSIFLKVRRLI